MTENVIIALIGAAIPASLTLFVLKSVFDVKIMVSGINERTKGTERDVAEIKADLEQIEDRYTTLSTRMDRLEWRMERELKD